jgi:HSP20 family protein
MKLIRYSNPLFGSFAPAFGRVARSPWSGLEEEIDRMFASTLSDFGWNSASSRFPLDVYEDNHNTYVRAELPGIKREDINVEMVDGYLTITARRATAPATGNGKTAETEGENTPAESASFSRSVSIADPVEAEKVSAAYENGVLTVTLPKREDARPKKIAVAVK